MDCVQSLISQRYPDFEILLVNDGSKDNTLHVARDLEKNYPNIRAINKANGGKASALNYGIEQSSGEIVVCIDADSLFLEDTVESRSII